MEYLKRKCNSASQAVPQAAVTGNQDELMEALFSKMMAEFSKLMPNNVVQPLVAPEGFTIPPPSVSLFDSKLFKSDVGYPN